MGLWSKLKGKKKSTTNTQAFSTSDDEADSGSEKSPRNNQHAEVHESQRVHSSLPAAAAPSPFGTPLSRKSANSGSDEVQPFSITPESHASSVGSNKKNVQRYVGDGLLDEQDVCVTPIEQSENQNDQYQPDANGMDGEGEEYDQEAVELAMKLLQAAMEGDCHGINEIVRDGALLQATDERGNSALHLAVINQQPEAVDLLLQLGSEVDSPNDEGDTPLMLTVCADGERVRMLESLLKAGANTKHRNEIGCELIHYAAGNGAVDILRYCAEHLSLDFRAVNNDSMTPLGCAVFQGEVEATREICHIDPYLLKVQDANGDLPIHLAALEGKGDVMRVLVDEFGEDVMSLNSRNETAVFVATEAMEDSGGPNQQDCITCFQDVIKPSVMQKADALLKESDQINDSTKAKKMLSMVIELYELIGESDQAYVVQMSVQQLESEPVVGKPVKEVETEPANKTAARAGPAKTAPPPLTEGIDPLQGLVAPSPVDGNTTSTHKPQNSDTDTNTDIPIENSLIDANAASLSPPASGADAANKKLAFDALTVDTKYILATALISVAGQSNPSVRSLVKVLVRHGHCSNWMRKMITSKGTKATSAWAALPVSSSPAITFRAVGKVLAESYMIDVIADCKKEWMSLAATGFISPEEMADGLLEAVHKNHSSLPRQIRAMLHTATSTYARKFDWDTDPAAAMLLAHLVLPAIQEWSSYFGNAAPPNDKIQKYRPEIPDMVQYFDSNMKEMADSEFKSRVRSVAADSMVEVKDAISDVSFNDLSSITDAIDYVASCWDAVEAEAKRLKSDKYDPSEFKERFINVFSDDDTSIGSSSDHSMHALKNDSFPLQHQDNNWIAKSDLEMENDNSTSNPKLETQAEIMQSSFDSPSSATGLVPSMHLIGESPRQENSNHADPKPMEQEEVAAEAFDEGTKSSPARHHVHSHKSNDCNVRVELVAMQAMGEALQAARNLKLGEATKGTQSCAVLRSSIKLICEQQQDVITNLLSAFRKQIDSMGIVQ